MGNSFEISSKDENYFDRSFINEIKNKVILDKLIELIDEVDDIVGDEEAYLTKKIYILFASKFLNQNQLDKTYNLLSESSDKIMKFELYSLCILVSKASFEAKIHTIFNLFCINDETTLQASDFILLIKSVLNSVYKVSKVTIPSDKSYLEFLQKKCPGCLFNKDFE